MIYLIRKVFDTLFGVAVVAALVHDRARASDREHELERLLKQLLYHAGDDGTFEKCREGRVPWPVATVEKARALVDAEYEAFLKSGSPVDSD